jgi:rhodanese-related sulfurtransferase
MPQSCASCLDFSTDKIVKSVTSLKPNWLKDIDYVEDFIQNKKEFSIKYPKIYDTSMEVDFGKGLANKRILYWCANSKRGHNPIIVGAKEAYGSFSNHGIVETNSSGKAKLLFKCPQLYSTLSDKGKKRTYFRHLHFVVANKKIDNWLPQIYTKIITCTYSLKEFGSMKKSGMYVILNTLPSEYYAKDHIPNSYNLNYKTISKMSQSELQEWFYDIVVIHYPKLKEYLEKDKVEIYELPIITYCANEKCNASDLAMEELMKKGFVNVCEYSGGMQEYRKTYKHD